MWTASAETKEEPHVECMSIALRTKTPECHTCTVPGVCPLPHISHWLCDAGRNRTEASYTSVHCCLQLEEGRKARYHPYCKPGNHSDPGRLPSLKETSMGDCGIPCQLRPGASGMCRDVSLLWNNGGSQWATWLAAVVYLFSLIPQS